MKMVNRIIYGLMNFYLKQNCLPKGRETVRQAAGGFTLIEILVAITIFVLMMTALFNAFNLLSDGVGAVGEGTSVYAQARSCFDRMMVDLQSIYVMQPPAYEPPDFDDDPDPFRFVCDNPYDDGGQLRFVAFSHLSLGCRLQAAVGRITYYLHNKQDGDTVLMRRDEMLHIEESAPSGADPIVCEHVRSFTVECVDAEGGEHEYWDSDDKDVDYATPRAVRLVLVVGDDGQSERTFRFETVVALPVYREKVGDV